MTNIFVLLMSNVIQITIKIIKMYNTIYNFQHNKN